MGVLPILYDLKYCFEKQTLTSYQRLCKAKTDLAKFKIFLLTQPRVRLRDSKIQTSGCTKPSARLCMDDINYYIFYIEYAKNIFARCHEINRIIINRALRCKFDR